MNPSTATVTILDIKDLRFAYPGQPPLAAGWSASIGTGATLLYGDTGTGKSTLLRVLAGTLPANGLLSLSGARLDREPEAYRRNVFYCDPETEAFHKVTATECATSLNAGDARFSDAMWRSCIDGFALSPHLEKPMYMLSTGSRRKVLLAAALASGRTLTLLDEPTAALDSASIRFLWEALADIARRSDRALVVASADRPDALPLSGVIELPLRST